MLPYAAHVQSLDTNLALTNWNTIGELLDQGLWAPRMGAALLTVFGGVALILAIVGVYGVLSYSVNQQTREIGIRMAMGAQTGSVLSLVVKQGMRLAIVGLVLGLVVAFAAMRLLSSLLFGVSAHDPLIFGGVTLILASGCCSGLLHSGAQGGTRGSAGGAAVRVRGKSVAIRVLSSGEQADHLVLFENLSAIFPAAVYQIDSYRYWEEQLRRNDFSIGQFGENFTVEGLPDDEVCIGDRYRIGSALFEVTQPRVTCYRVGIRTNEPRMAALLVQHHRPGFYFRVLEEGQVGAGDEIVKVRAGHCT